MTELKLLIEKPKTVVTNAVATVFYSVPKATNKRTAANAVKYSQFQASSADGQQTNDKQKRQTNDIGFNSAPKTANKRTTANAVKYS